MTKLSPLAAIAVVIAGTFAATPAGAEALFKFDGGIGSQPLRAGPGGTVVSNSVAGVAPGGAPWPIEALKAEIGHDGRIRASVKGVLLGGTDNIGTRGGPRQMVISLFCRNTPAPGAVAGTLQTDPYNSEFVALDPNGDFKLDSTLTNASGATPQAGCGDTIDNRPVLLVRTVAPANPATGAPAAPSAWFAAGIIKD
ncbi:hypothetical protein [Variovorax saccharolyticus]|uniref:hypothetical protein n=1 Tax=Variovorax saccharolyticus TaxID=3053516 RepID=UPI002575CE96|nr:MULTISPECIES: hypothetical protein [unclassified Variovorax]MDM0020885.1 hypothetical protein [Variovorax sp. J22R187]MDM0025227.1 hypothetical protein [Variovorax sp. J31P216]